MTAMAAKAWVLSLLVLALSGCGALRCQYEGRFWDGCNWCYCQDHEVVGCTNMACLSVPQDAYRLDPHRATIGPPQREGLFAYRPGRGRVVDPSGWPCQLGSSWLEEGGCVRCICASKKIKCRDSGMCLNGEPVSNELMSPQTEYVRLRRDNAAAAPPAAESGAEPAAEPAAAPTTAATEPSTTTAWAATEPAAATTAAGVAEPAETTAAPAVTTAANATQSTVAPPATTTAQNTVVKDRSCRSGSTWEEDCNSCWCLDNGRAACTTNSCEPPPPLPLGAPGAPATTVAAPAATPTASAGAAAPAAGVAAVAQTAAPTQQAAPAAPAAEPTAAPAGSTSTSSSASRRKRRVVPVGA